VRTGNHLFLAGEGEEVCTHCFTHSVTHSLWCHLITSLAHSFAYCDFHFTHCITHSLHHSLTHCTQFTSLLYCLIILWSFCFITQTVNVYMITFTHSLFKFASFLINVLSSCCFVTGYH
jgi:hypothetical protein